MQKPIYTADILIEVYHAINGNMKNLKLKETVLLENKLVKVFTLEEVKDLDFSAEIFGKSKENKVLKVIDVNFVKRIGSGIID